MFRPAVVIWSKVPVIVTFGAGGGVCAKTGSAGIAKMTKASTAVSTLLLITASSSGGEKHRIPCQHSTPTSPTTPVGSRIGARFTRGFLLVRALSEFLEQGKSSKTHRCRARE